LIRSAVGEEAELQQSGSRQVHLRLDQRRQGSVAYLTIDNSRRHNALNGALIGELTGAIRGVEGNEELRAVVLSGAGAKAFIAGVDIDEMAAIKNTADAKVFIGRLHRCCAALRELPVPVIARIHGYCFGGGLEIAASCDVRIAADTALFGMPEVKLGIPSVIEAALLPMLVGFGRAREIVLLGETFSAAEALAWRLVERVVPASSLDNAVEAWIGRLLTSRPRAVRLQKKLIRRWEELPLKEAVAAGMDAFAAAYETDEPQTAMREFLARRKKRTK
jgi:enoyl-CoA hydratase